MTDRNYKWIGRGIYSLSNAAYLTGIPSEKISRWLKGYQHNISGHRIAPVIGQGLEAVDGKPTLSFADLIEIQFISKFRSYGIRMKVIRYTAGKAAEILQTDHPFSSKSFRTDGKRIIYETAEEIGDKKLLDLYNDQYQIGEIVDEYLRHSIEYLNNTPGKWWPLGLERQVVVDPKRAFGAPIVNEGSVQTAIIAGTYQAEDRDAEVVAGWYDISVDAVNDAVEFEQKLAA